MSNKIKGQKKKKKEFLANLCFAIKFCIISINAEDTLENCILFKHCIVFLKIHCIGFYCGLHIAFCC